MYNSTVPLIIHNTHTRDSYLHRNDEELEKILKMETEKSHTSSHYRHQFASCEDALRSLIVKERELFQGAGFGQLTTSRNFASVCTYWI